MRMCQIFKTNSDYIVVSIHKSDIGLRFNSETKIKIASTADAKVFSEAMEKVLADSKTGVPMPSDPKVITHELITFSGFKKWADFAKASQLVSVDDHGNECKVTRFKLGEKSAFFPDGPVLTCSRDQLVSVVLSAFE